jgi:hypothetical protein
MFSYLEKFFPDLIERIRRLPATVKVVIAVVLALESNREEWKKGSGVF